VDGAPRESALLAFGAAAYLALHATLLRVLHYAIQIEQIEFSISISPLRCDCRAFT
jgi:hypothetical protein